MIIEWVGGYNIEIPEFVKWGIGNSEGEGDFEILLLFYSEIELAFQIINLPWFLFGFLCFLCSNVYVTVFVLCLCYMFMFKALFYSYKVMFNAKNLCVCGGGRFVIKWGWGVDF